MNKKKVILSEISTTPGTQLEKKQVKEEIEKMKEQLSELQQRLYAQGKYALLVVFQGMDASGKDGAIKDVFSGVNPAGCNVTSFKVPSEEEAKHDFLWRIHKACPPKGMIHVFNRSHYEDIRATTVHKLFDTKAIEKRYTAINAFEQLLVDNDTIIFKFYLHVSEEEQLERIQERQTDPYKRWKYQEGDVNEIKLRKQFVDVYERIFDECSEAAPWHIIPSDKNWYKVHTILSIMLEKLKEYKIDYPEAKYP